MAREPSYPEDAPVGAGAEGDPGSGGEAPVPGGSTGTRRTRKIVTGAAIGIGSAALVAALLYANRSRRNGDKEE